MSVVAPEKEKSSPATFAESEKSQWRTTLGHYPTGVAIITSVDEAGAPVGMVVGTFTSVSESPLLVGFLPMATSSTLPHVLRAGRFRASVLGAEHEAFCRDFFRASREERFSSPVWSFDAYGMPRLDDAVVWCDARIHDVHDAGDHRFVLGMVEDFGHGSVEPRPPLLFYRGGYTALSAGGGE